MSHKYIAWLVIGVLGCGALGSRAQDRRCEDYYPLRKGWFGDLHVHTALSLDAAVQGTRATPQDAYRYARGEPIAVPPYGPHGLVLRKLALDRPIDFAAVTDHAETLGSGYICSNPQAPGYDSWYCLGLRRFPHLFGLLINYQVARGRWPGYCGEAGQRCVDAGRTPWDEIRAAAELAYDRSPQCRFTSFVGYEWTGAAFAGLGRVANLHRNIIFANGAVPALPVSFLDAPTPAELYSRLDQQCVDAGTGCAVVAIPHNANLSLGLMFPQDDEVDPAQRARFETLVEIMQHKGASECAAGPPGAPGRDELCQFEMLPWDSLSGNRIGLFASPPQETAGYAREVLGRGLEARAAGKVNPYQFGFIGSTDSHRGLAGGTAEAGFPGHGGAGNRAVKPGAAGLPDQWEFNPGGLAVLYAEQNTRASLFAAIKRREAYATSGTRIEVRFFGGSALPPDLCGQADLLERGYRLGVPMGGELSQAAASLRFAVMARKDPGSARAPGNDLQRVQIVKGWIDADGRSQQRVYDVAGKDAAKAGEDAAKAGKDAAEAGEDAAEAGEDAAEAGEDRADPGDCTASGGGARQLCAVWEDPDFQPAQPAFYYARVLEVPSCRWTARACQSQGVDCAAAGTLTAAQRPCCDGAISNLVQERAWTSPIWYSPPAE